MFSFVKAAGFASVAFLWSSIILQAQTSVLTQHNDLYRTGQNLNETILTPASVSGGSFGKLFSLAVDGVVETQPLYVANLTIAGVSHNVVFVGTEHDSVYAFDADTGGSPLWQVSLLDAAHGATAGATSDSAKSQVCSISNSEYGISGTPVIDPSTNTLYVVSDTFENNYPVERLHALDITSGSEKFNGPAVIAASVSGTGSGSSNGVLAYDPNLQTQRAGLALVKGTVYIAYGSNCDFDRFHGWLFAYNAATLAQTSVLLTTPNGVDSGIWMGAGAPAVDTENNVTRMFVSTGNGTYDASTPYGTNSMDYGDDILTLNLANGLGIVDAFTPYNQSALQQSDSDLGAGGPLLLPDQPGPYPHLLIVGGKGATLYVLNRDNLGGYNTTTDNVVQELNNVVQPIYGQAAYWNSNVYLWPSADTLKQFTLTNGQLSATPLSVSPQIQASGIGATPSISANGAAGGIVWSIDRNQSPQVLYAHDATNLANTLWSSSTNAARDSAGLPVKFPVPTVVNGKVYVGANDQVLVYGLPDFSLSSASTSVTVTQGLTATDSVTISPLYGFSGTVTLSAANLPAGVTVSFATASSASVATFVASTSAAPGSYTVTLTAVSGTLTHSVNVTLVVAAAPVIPDFSLTSASSSTTITQGQTATDSISISSLDGFTGSVALSAASLPSGVTASFSTTLTASVATFTASASAAAGSYPITITGVSGALSHTVALTLVVVTPPVAADFTLAISPASLTISAGTTGMVKLTTSGNQTFSGNVTLSCSVASTLTNVTCSVPSSVASGSGSVILSVTAGANAVSPSLWHRPSVPLHPPLLMYGLTMLLLAAFAYSLTRRKRGLWQAGLAALVVVCICSCHGPSNSSSSSSSGSESGMITVSGVGGSVSHSTTVSVTVQ